MFVSLKVFTTLLGCSRTFVIAPGHFNIKFYYVLLNMFCVDLGGKKLQRDGVSNECFHRTYKYLSKDFEE